MKYISFFEHLYISLANMVLGSATVSGSPLNLGVKANLYVALTPYGSLKNHASSSLIGIQINLLSIALPLSLRSRSSHRSFKLALSKSCTTINKLQCLLRSSLDQAKHLFLSLPDPSP